MNLVYAVIFIPRVIESFQLLSPPPTNGVDITSHDDTRTFFHMQLSLTSSAQILSAREERVATLIYVSNPCNFFFVLYWGHGLLNAVQSTDLQK